MGRKDDASRILNGSLPRPIRTTKSWPAPSRNSSPDVALSGPALACILLAGCASVPPVTLAPRDQVRDFALDGRFALRVTLPGSPAESSGGRLDWTTSNGSDRILLANPLGYGLAEIEPARSFPACAPRWQGFGNPPTPTPSIEQVTGQRLPITRLPAWLLGRGTRRRSKSIRTDGRPANCTKPAGRSTMPTRTDTPDALPERVTLSRRRGSNCKLRIEEWKKRREPMDLGQRPGPPRPSSTSSCTSSAAAPTATTCCKRCSASSTVPTRCVSRRATMALSSSPRRFPACRPTAT
jgi:outer membrane lipoprotein LolB